MLSEEIEAVLSGRKRWCVVCADNAILAEIPTTITDLVVTSPPYDSLRTYGGHSWDFHTVAKGLSQVVLPGGVVVWVVADETVNGSETGTSMRQALHFKDECGFNLWDTMIWNKGVSTTPTESRYYAVWEYCFVFSKGKPKALNFLNDRKNISAGSKRVSLKNCRKEGREYGGKSFITQSMGRRFNLWTINPSCKENDHPAVFPIALARDHVLSWSNDNDVVLDPFCGSGTTLVAAIQTGRRAIGIEIDPNYADIARRRCEQAEREQREILFPAIDAPRQQTIEDLLFE